MYIVNKSLHCERERCFPREQRVPKARFLVVQKILKKLSNIHSKRDHLIASLPILFSTAGGSAPPFKLTICATIGRTAQTFL